MIFGAFCWAQKNHDNVLDCTLVMVQVRPERVGDTDKAAKRTLIIIGRSKDTF